MRVEIFTDGACRGNPGPGGWGAVMRYKDQQKFLKGGELCTTNNRMELMAAIQALAALTRSCQVELTTDSKYLREGITTWLNNWKKNNWRTSQRQPVKNQDLWVRLEQETGRHQINWHWIKGHSGHQENEIADQLANQAIDELMVSHFSK
jgi:ribonuclease HI